MPLVSPGLAAPPFRLVGDQDERLSGAADERGEMPVTGVMPLRASIMKKIASAASMAASVWARMRRSANPGRWPRAPPYR